jgi:hypothetical protein
VAERLAASREEPNSVELHYLLLPTLEIQQKCCRGSLCFAHTCYEPGYVSYFISISLVVRWLPPTKTTDKYIQVDTCVFFAETHDAYQRHPFFMFMRYPAILIIFLTIICSPCRFLLMSIESRLICFDRNAAIESLNLQTSRMRLEV